MSAAAPSRRARHRWHAPEKGSGPAFALSLLAHAALFIAIAFMVRWKSEPVASVSAELWSLPPAAVQQPPPLRPVKVELPPPEPEPRKADIVMEQKKAPPPKPPPPKLEPKVDVPKKLEVKSAPAEKAAPVERPPDPIAAIQRALKQAGSATGPASSSAAAGISDAYSAQIQGCIRPHIVFNVPDGIKPRQFEALFEVTLLPTGEQAGAPRLIKASGLPAYDQAVERAIRRCDPFPRPRDAPMPRSLPILFDPVER